MDLRNGVFIMTPLEDANEETTKIGHRTTGNEDGGSMEKICIVKLRKNLTNHMENIYRRRQGQIEEMGIAPLMSASEIPRTQETHDCESATDGHREATDRKLSLTLTRDQMRALQSDPRVASLLYEKAHEVSAKVGHRGEEMIIQVVLPSLPPVRLLKQDDVTRMLRVSRSYLRRILKEGKLKSYKLGRLRRVMLDDVLSYLESHQELPPITQQAAKAKASRNGMAQPYAIKEG
jgi:excisionase family DNA binding protein